MPEMPEFIRKAMEAQGRYDPDEALAQANAAIASDEIATIEETGDWRAQLAEERADLSEAERAMIDVPLFDAEASRQGRDAGMAQADAAASPDWKHAAGAALDRIIERGGEFTADDVWAEVGTFPRERRALGPLLKKAADDGRIVNTGRRKNSERPEHHSYPMTIWRCRD